MLAAEYHIVCRGQLFCIEKMDGYVHMAILVEVRFFALLSRSLSRLLIDVGKSRESHKRKSRGSEAVLSEGHRATMMCQQKLMYSRDDKRSQTPSLEYSTS